MRSIKSGGGLTRGREITESVRHQWAHTNHACAAIYDAITKIKNLSLLSSEQHTEMGKTRKERDYKDLLTLYSPFPNNSPTLLIKVWIFCRTPFLINFPDFVLQIFQRLLKPIVLFVKL